jgi:hypothetical protein
LDWIHLTDYRGQWRHFVNTIMNLLVPSGAGSFFSGWATAGSSTGTLLHGVSYKLLTFPVGVHISNIRLHSLKEWIALWRRRKLLL